MNKRDYSRKENRAKRVPLGKLLESQVLLTLGRNEKCDVQRIPVEIWDAWADSLCEEITGVKRDVWDVFARQKFVNQMLADGVLEMQAEADGSILLLETEEKSSAPDVGAEVHASQEDTNGNP